jgi:hypothetical protein
MSPSKPGKARSVAAELADLQKLLLDSIGDDPPLSELELIERALMLTLSNPSIHETSRAFEYVIQFGSHGKTTEQVEKGVHAPTVLPINAQQMAMSRQELTGLAKRAFKEIARRWWDAIIDERLKFRWAVELIISNPRNARKELSPYMIEPALNGLVAVPRLSWNGRKLRTDIYYYSHAIEGAIAYALMLMLDTDKKIGEALRVCKLEYCDRIFLSKPPQKGGPRPRYCNPEHKLASDKLTGAERTARWRNKPKK